MIPKLLRITNTAYNSLKQLVVKTKSAKATYTAEEYSPFGTDSRPFNGMTAIYIRTEADGDECIIGYLQKDRLAEIGEHRIYSTNSDGQLQAFVWLKNDGKILLNGDGKGGIPVSEDLVDRLNKIENKINALTTYSQNHVHSGVTTGGGSSGPAVTPVSGSLALTTEDDIANPNILQE